MRVSKNKSIYEIFLPVGVLVAALALWQVAAICANSDTTPIEAFLAAGQVLREVIFWRSLCGTLSRAAVAFAVSFFTGFVAALLASKFRQVSNVIAPIITIIRSVPTMAIVLILIITFRASVATVMVATLVLFPTFYAALLPVAGSVRREYLELAQVYGADWRQKLTMIYLPSMAPSLIENGLSGLSLAIKLTVSAEVLGQTARSIGMMMQSARSYLQGDRLLALTVLVVAVCLILELCGKLVYRLLNR